MYITKFAGLTNLALCAFVSATPAPFPKPIPDMSIAHSSTATSPPTTTTTSLASKSVRRESGHFAQQDPPPKQTIQDGTFTGKLAKLTLTSYDTTDCSAPSFDSYHENEVDWNVMLLTTTGFFYSYHLSRNLTGAEQLDFYTYPRYAGDVGVHPGAHMETSSPDANGTLQVGAGDPGPERPCYTFAKSAAEVVPDELKKKAPGVGVYSFLLWNKLDAIGDQGDSPYNKRRAMKRESSFERSTSSNP